MNSAGFRLIAGRVVQIIDLNADPKAQALAQKRYEEAVKAQEAFDADINNLSLFNFIRSGVGWPAKIGPLGQYGDDKFDLLVEYFEKHPSLDVNTYGNAREHAGAIAKEDDDAPPLGLCAQYNRPKCCSFLLSKGALIEGANARGKTPLMYASQLFTPTVAKTLIEEGGANVNAQSNCGKTPLAYAASVGCYHLCSYLIQQGADVNQADKAKKTPLMTAASNTTVRRPGRTRDIKRISGADYLRVLEVLCIEGNADLTLKDEDGLTALDHAKKIYYDPRIAQFLISYPARKTGHHHESLRLLFGVLLIR